jgi:hypothetical protein
LNQSFGDFVNGSEIFNHENGPAKFPFLKAG